jgi:hypothetical protein
MNNALPNAKFSPLILGALPHGRVGRKLNIRLRPGTVHFTIPAQRHSFRRHPKDFHICLPYLSQAVNNPTYVGQSPGHRNSGFELVLEVPGGRTNILVALVLNPDARGVYRVTSIYRIDNNTIFRRLRKGYLTRF